MNAIEIICAVILIVVSAIIIFFTLIQEQKGQGLSGAIMGDTSNLVSAGRARSNEAQLAKVTKICGIIFFVVTIVVCVVSAHIA